jgi:hypothetical protein
VHKLRASYGFFFEAAPRWSAVVHAAFYSVVIFPSARFFIRLFALDVGGFAAGAW